MFSNSWEINADGTSCECVPNGTSIRPCIGNTNIGNIFGNTCKTPKDITLVIDCVPEITPTSVPTWANPGEGENEISVPEDYPLVLKVDAGEATYFSGIFNFILFYVQFFTASYDLRTDFEVSIMIFKKCKVSTKHQHQNL